MSRLHTPTPEQEAGWRAWLAGRPEAVRLVAERFDPWSLYRLKSSGSRVTVHSFQETDPVTLTVNVSAQFNALMFERQVFGVAPEDLEPCDPPAPGEPTGAVFTEWKDVDQFIDIVRDEDAPHEEAP